MPDFSTKPAVPPERSEAAILGITRPDPSLWHYYLLHCAATLPFFPILVVPAWFRYHTMRYKFTDEGISMSWGLLFRREVIVNYARIQDIHLRSNLIERWFGLAKVQIQTASGSASAEMTLEGLKEFEAVRDFLYSKMRGVKDQPRSQPNVPSLAETELAATLREVARELREIRLALSARNAAGPGGPGHV